MVTMLMTIEDVSKIDDVIAHIFSFLKGGEIFNNFSNENV